MRFPEDFLTQKADGLENVKLYKLLHKMENYLKQYNILVIIVKYSTFFYNIFLSKHTQCH